MEPRCAPSSFDVIVIGGGINGTAIARDVAGRGLSVCLCEADDLAAHTSSASSKLIHGGLRYLEQFAFHLVRESLIERSIMLRTAPHITRGLQFVLPHEPHLRPAWEVGVGLFLYDHLGGSSRGLPRSHRIDLSQHVAGRDLQPQFRTGFVYSDVQVKDARLVVLNAMDARAHGAHVLTHTRCERATAQPGAGWEVTLRDAGGTVSSIQGRVLVNATGPWASSFLDNITGIGHRQPLRLVQGSHIVVPRLCKHEYAYTFQLPDRRIVFAIPFEDDYTLVGTTDVEYHGDPSRTSVGGDEVSYLCAAANRYFKHAISPADVRWSFSGVRPLLGDGSVSAQNVTRGYRLELRGEPAPILSVFGGKVTTARRLAEEVTSRLRTFFPRLGPKWTSGHALPGGDCPDMPGYSQRFQEAHPWLPVSIAVRWTHSYGTLSDRLLAGVHRLADLGADLGGGLYEAEVEYLQNDEWATCAEDILWRRSKLGLRLTSVEAEALQRYVRSASGSPTKHGGAAPPAATKVRGVGTDHGP